MKYFTQGLIILLLLNNCSSAPKAVFRLKSKTGWMPDGTWHPTDPGTGQKLKKSPVFVFAKDNVFVDSSQSVCRLEKIESGELILDSTSITPFTDYDKVPQLQNCPKYMYAWDETGLVILHSDKSPSRPNIHFLFAPTEAWQFNAYVNREYYLLIKIAGKNGGANGFYPTEISFPVLRESRK